MELTCFFSFLYGDFVVQLLAGEREKKERKRE
jgi:hypothetical protein